MTSRTGKKSCNVPYVSVRIGVTNTLLQGLYNAGVDSKLNIQSAGVRNQVIFAKKLPFKAMDYVFKGITVWKFADNLEKT